jgi:hypothetical protein
MPIDNYLLIEQEDEIRAAAAQQRQEMFAARARAMMAPRPPEPWRWMVEQHKAASLGTWARYVAVRKGTLAPSDHIATLVAAQREHDRRAYAMATNMGVAPRGMLPDTQVAHTSGLPSWTTEVNSLWFFCETGSLCPPGDRPQPVGNRPAMWGSVIFPPPFELKADLSPEAAKVIVDRQIWRPGERREWDPGTPLPEVP